MKQEEIYQVSIDRKIDPVIKADQNTDADLEHELKEYVISSKLEKHIETFFKNYASKNPISNGVWVSGHFGSGKSHLIKMLSIVLEDRKLAIGNSSDIFKDKLSTLSNAEWVIGELEKITKIPSESILFNIDQKAQSKEDDENFNTLLSAFLKVFNEHCGYCGEHPFIANFERDLDQENLLDGFISEIEKLTEQNWKDVRDRHIRNSSFIDQAYNHVTNSEQSNIIDKYREDFRISIDSFAELVNQYIDAKEKTHKKFRLNFFVDEIGQFIAEKTKLMVNLQTIAESLFTRTNTRAWLIVTSQEAVSDCIGKFSGQDFTKIQDRFKTQLHLNNADVEEIVEKRLLVKNEQGTKELEKIYSKYEKDFKTIFFFQEGEGATKYNSKDYSLENFVRSFPFVPYQFELFQSAIESLSANNAFTGSHKSVGNRALIYVFQKIAEEIKDRDLNTLVSFDRMYDHISDLKGTISTVIDNAAKKEDEFTVKVLKVLALVKYLNKDFKAKCKNITTLLIEDLSTDISKLMIKVQEALNILERNSYIERNGEEYSYLTNEEKNIETQIKQTEIDQDEIRGLFKRVVFDEILTANKKVIDDTNKHPYEFAIKVDGKLYGRDNQLSVSVCTPFGELSEDQVKSRSLDGRDLMIYLDCKQNLRDDITMSLQTEKFYNQNLDSLTIDSHKEILERKKSQNNNKKDKIKAQIIDCIKESNSYVSGKKLELGGEAKDMIHNAFKQVIRSAYSQLSLNDAVITEQDIRKHSKADSIATQISLREDSRSILNYIKSQDDKGIKVYVKNIIDKFKEIPYGWAEYATLNSLIKLVINSKIELIYQTETLKIQELPDYVLKNNLSSSVAINVCPDIGIAEISQFKTFYQDYTHNPPPSNDPKSLVENFKNFLRDELINKLESYQREKSKYPFLHELDELIASLKELTKNSIEFYFAEDFLSKTASLLELKEKKINPLIKFFENQAQKDIYDNAIKFNEQNKFNSHIFTASKLEELEKLLDDPAILEAKENLRTLKSLTEDLLEELKQALVSDKQESLLKIDKLYESIQAEDNFSELNEQALEKIQEEFSSIKEQIDLVTNLADLKITVENFEKAKFENILALVHELDTREEFSNKEGDNEISEVEGGASALAVKTKEEKKQVIKSLLIKLTDLNLSYRKSTVKSKDDLKDYLNSLEASISEEIDKGNIVQV